MVTPNGDIDTLLLSCRILGKGIEYAFTKEILLLLKRERTMLTASYIPTAKNAQVADFYEKIGFSLMSEKNGIKNYSLKLSNANLQIEDYYHITIK